MRGVILIVAGLVGFACSHIITDASLSALGWEPEPDEYEEFLAFQKAKRQGRIPAKPTAASIPPLTRDGNVTPPPAVKP